MIKDKVIEYWQREHPQEWEAMQEEFNEYWREVSHKYIDTAESNNAEELAGFFMFEFTEDGAPDTTQHTYIHRETLLHSYYFNSAQGILADSYIKSFKKEPKRVYNDINDILDALDKSDFIKHIEELNNDYIARKYNERVIIRRGDGGGYSYEWEKPKTGTPEYKSIFTENYNACVSFILSTLPTQRLVIEKYLDGDEKKLTELIDAKARQWYPDTAPAGSDPARQDQTPPEATARTIVRHTDILEYPLDKVNARVWNLFEKDTGGQIAIDYAFDMLPKKPELKAYAMYSINFDELDKLGDSLKITRRLTPFDKRVYTAVATLYNAGNDIITLSQIYYAMGQTGKKAGDNDRDRINDALTKMRGALIHFDNGQEAEAIPNYKHYKYDGSLLPMERLTATVNGKVTDGAIKLFREPPLMTFAKRRNQVTTLPIKLLQSPISKTESNLAIDDYLLERISREKRKDVKECRLLYEKIYQRANITTRMQRKRAPEKIRKYLTYYKQQGFIKDFTDQPDGITIYF